MKIQPLSQKPPYHLSLIINGRTSKAILGFASQMEERIGGTVPIGKKSDNEHWWIVFRKQAWESNKQSLKSGDPNLEA